MTNIFADALGHIRSFLGQGLTQIIGDDSPCALIDYPNHENVGDAAIWVGERKLLREHDRKVAYVSDIASYSARSLRRRIGTKGVILLHGGGNLGDLYPHHQVLRESVIESFPRHRIVVMPQTATFHANGSFERIQQVFDRHSDLTILLRDRHSLDFVRRHFRARSLLVPDSAFALERPRNAPMASHEIIWLARTDDEAGEHPASAMPTPMQCSNVSVRDWVGKRSAPPGFVAWRVATLAGGAVSRMTDGRPASLGSWLCQSYDALAEHRVSYGMHVLGPASVIVTDRLHGHILAVILGIPHVLLNDRYDKVGRFYRTWTADHPSIRFATNPRDAVVQAQTLLAARG